MINKVELGSVNKKSLTPRSAINAQKRGDVNFTGLGDVALKLGDAALKGVQACEANPMLNVTVLDMSTAILPRTFFETVIGSKKKDENGNPAQKRKLNIMGGFEAFRREGSGLLINCIIPGFVVAGVAKLLNRPIMGGFKSSNLTNCWANSDSINSIEKFYTAASGATSEEKIFNTLKSMTDSIEGVNGDVAKGGLKKFGTILENDPEYIETLRTTAKNIAEGKKPKGGYAKDLYKYLVGKTGIAENIRFSGETKFSPNSLGHLCDSTCDVLRGVVKEQANNGIKNAQDLTKYFSKAKTLINAKSIAGLGVIIPLAISAQPINRWITHKLSGKKGAPIYNDDKERILTPEEKKKLTADKFFAVPLMWAVTALSMIMDKPSLKMFQFKGIFPTMDQARIISAATFSSRLAAAEDSNELKESTIRDIATFSSFYFLGDYAAKGIATFLEKHNKSGIILTNKLTELKPGANGLEKFWHWAKHTKMKSTDELKSIGNSVLRTKATNMRAICQLGSMAFSLASLGVFIPIYTRTQSNKKGRTEQVQPTPKTFADVSFAQNYLRKDSDAFKQFLS